MTVFSKIYRLNGWNGTETRSGPGSNKAPTAPVAKALSSLIHELGITSVIDAACGEGYWQPALPGYLGLDVAPEAIEAARQFHPDREYRVWDVRKGCPRADLVICRDALQHLSLKDGVAVLNAIRESGSRWMLLSTYIGGRNGNGPSGKYVYFEPDLEMPPYNLPNPFRLIRDGYAYSDAETIRDPRKMLGLWAC